MTWERWFVFTNLLVAQVILIFKTMTDALLNLRSGGRTFPITKVKREGARWLINSCSSRVDVRKRICKFPRDK